MLRAPQAAGTQGDILSPGVPAEPVPAEAGGAGPAPAAGPGSGNVGSKGPLASEPPAQSGRCCRPGDPGQALGPCRASLGGAGGAQSRLRSRASSSQACRVGPVRQAPGVWHHQDGCAPAFRGDSAHPPSPAWTSPGAMHHRGGDKAWRGEGTSTTVWSPGPGPWGLGAPGGHCVQAGPALQSHSQSCLGPTLELEPAQPPAHTL